ncbi:hypothetical protein HU200_011968 [Digitaria exilis]|uniref:Pectinesterase n=1 Tax=Digitaria exilis TaxID=1010633 RepID=A0A835KM95_9POAL|nr:hypothetical protein HU200_011968 [Digitaria exilis]
MTSSHPSFFPIRTGDRNVFGQVVLGGGVMRKRPSFRSPSHWMMPASCVALRCVLCRPDVPMPPPIYIYRSEAREICMHPTERRASKQASARSSRMRVKVELVVITMTTLLLLACRGSHGHAASAADIEEELPPAWAVPHLRRLLARHKVDAVVDVSTRGGHHYGSIAEALAAAPPPPGRYTVHVRAGIYREPINITRSNVTLIGDGMGPVSGDGFMARDLTLQNTAGVSAGPAVALMSMSDQSVYYRCELDGYQDTLNVDCKRQFFHSCRIMGTVDFIFGYAKAVFQECQILVRRSVDGKDNVITAQGRDGPDNQSGFVFQRCAVKALPGDHLDTTTTKTFLGRPWKKHSHVVFMRCALDSIVNPGGWLQWKATTPVPDTVYYAEYRNTGPGANTQGRVKWDQLHLLKEPAEVANFSVHNFIQGDDWLPRFGIIYDQE